MRLSMALTSMDYKPLLLFFTVPRFDRSLGISIFARFVSHGEQTNS
jgi:hypothetical protein